VVLGNPVPVVDVVAAATLPVEAAMLGFLTAREELTERGLEVKSFFHKEIK